MPYNCLNSIITPPNPCLGSNPCSQYTNAACVQYNGTLSCVTGPNPTLDVILRTLCNALGPQAGVSTTKVTITSAQLKNAFTVPVQIIAPPGAGKFIQLLAVYATYNYGTTPYVANGATELKLGPAAGSSLAYGLISILTGSATTYGPATLLGPPATTSFVNAPVLYYNDVANISGGDGTLTLYVTYLTLTV